MDRTARSNPAVDIVYFDAGSGHRSAAWGLEAALRRVHPDWRVRAVNLVDVTRGNPSFHRTTRAGIAYFNWMLRRDRVFDLPGLVRLSFLFHDLVTARGVRMIARYWAQSPPDVVVSVTPMNNEVLFRAARCANPRVQCVTVPVDFEEMTARYWFTPKVAAHYLVASDRLYDQARAAGIDEGCLLRLSGMVIDPRFYGHAPANRREELGKLGLDPERPTVLVSYGGQGCATVRGIARQLAGAGTPLNAIFLCGRDRRLFAYLSAATLPFPRLVLGYTPEPPVLYHYLADVLIGKPGSMTITEGVVTRTPLIVLKSRGMAPVQRGNEAWVRAAGVGLVVWRIADLGPAVRYAFTHGERLQAACARRAGQGVFEAAQFIASLAQPHAATPATGSATGASALPAMN